MSSLLLSLAVAAQCHTYTATCECGLATPFEGYQISVVVKCDNEESWYSDYGQRQFTSEEECRKAIPEDRTCLELPQS